jgi:hypothetical protein
VKNDRTRALKISSLSQRFDLVLLLAVVHHLRITEGIPIAEILTLAADVTRRYAIIEAVPPEDPMFRRLARGREALFSDCASSAFEAELQARFFVRDKMNLTNGRTLYLVERHQS